MSVLLPFVVVAAGVLGMVIGSFLNVVAYRVPAGISIMRESRCPHCDAPVKPWQNVPVVSWVALRGHCASCAAPIAPRYPLVEAATGLAFAGVAWLFIVSADDAAAAPVPAGRLGWATAVTIIAYLYFASISIVLTLIDLDTSRLPNAIVLPSYAVGGVLLTVASLLTGDWAALVRAGIGMAVLYAFYLLLRMVRPAAMGGGDVKLAGVVGMYLGYVGWGALAVGAFAAFLLGGVFGIVLILVRKAGKKSRIPFGPWMLAGAWVGIVFGEAAGRWYGALFLAAPV
jgi:leader peptidase (prepilin peptidase)/N-methyltransferase